MGELMPGVQTTRRRTSQEIIPFPDHSNDIQDLIATLKETNVHLSNIASVADDTLGAAKRYIPWVVAAIGVLWPTIGKIISSLPALPVG